MRRSALLLVLTLVPSLACRDPGAPDWLAALIDEFEQALDPPTLVARYDYHGQVVYYVGPRCCDVPSTLYSSAGTILCSPDGGYTGDGDGRCPDFFAQRRNEKVLWRP